MCHLFCFIAYICFVYCTLLHFQFIVRAWAQVSFQAFARTALVWRALPGSHSLFIFASSLARLLLFLNFMMAALPQQYRRALQVKLLILLLLHFDSRRRLALDRYRIAQSTWGKLWFLFSTFGSPSGSFVAWILCTSLQRQWWSLLLCLGSRAALVWRCEHPYHLPVLLPDSFVET